MDSGLPEDFELPQGDILDLPLSAQMRQAILMEDSIGQVLGKHFILAAVYVHDIGRNEEDIAGVDVLSQKMIDPLNQLRALGVFDPADPYASAIEQYMGVRVYLSYMERGIAEGRGTSVFDVEEVRERKAVIDKRVDEFFSERLSPAQRAEAEVWSRFLILDPAKRGNIMNRSRRQSSQSPRAYVFGRLQTLNEQTVHSATPKRRLEGK